MTLLDKHNLLSRLSTMKYVQLDLGCGNSKRNPDSIGIDLINYDCVDIVGDVLDVLHALPGHIVDDVYTSHYLEHTSHVPLILKELERVMKLDGTLTIIVPHFSNPYYYSDPTHISSFGLYSMSYFAKDNHLSRKVPNYHAELAFAIDNISLIFKSCPPFYVRHAIKTLFGVLVNINSYTKEFYEEFLSCLFPCYEIKYILRRISL